VVFPVLELQAEQVVGHHRDPQPVEQLQNREQEHHMGFELAVRQQSQEWELGLRSPVVLQMDQQVLRHMQALVLDRKLAVAQ